MLGMTEVPSIRSEHGIPTSTPPTTPNPIVANVVRGSQADIPRIPVSARALHCPFSIFLYKRRHPKTINRLQLRFTSNPRSPTAVLVLNSGDPEFNVRHRTSFSPGLYSELRSRCSSRLPGSAWNKLRSWPPRSRFGEFGTESDLAGPTFAKNRQGGHECSIQLLRYPAYKRHPRDCRGRWNHRVLLRKR